MNRAARERTTSRTLGRVASPRHNKPVSDRRPYSYRNATIGSVIAARRAGI
jgi:hypothetical protein